jgi:hypothetical protein
MGFFRDLKSLLTTGTRHPAGDGAPAENNVDAMKTDASAAWSPPAENVGDFGDSLAPSNWVPSQQDDRPRY